MFDLLIKEKVRQPLLSREMLRGEVAHAKAATPSVAEVRKRLAEALKVEEGAVVVQSVVNHFGSQKAHLIAYVYDSNEDALKYASKVALARNQPTRGKKEKAGESQAAVVEQPTKKK